MDEVCHTVLLKVSCSVSLYVNFLSPAAFHILQEADISPLWAPAAGGASLFPHMWPIRCPSPEVDRSLANTSSERFSTISVVAK